MITFRFSWLNYENKLLFLKALTMLSFSLLSFFGLVLNVFLLKLDSADSEIAKACDDFLYCSKTFIQCISQLNSITNKELSDD